MIHSGTVATVKKLNKQAGKKEESVEIQPEALEQEEKKITSQILPPSNSPSAYQTHYGGTFILKVKKKQLYEGSDNGPTY